MRHESVGSGSPGRLEEACALYRYHHGLLLSHEQAIIIAKWSLSVHRLLESVMESEHG